MFVFQPGGPPKIQLGYIYTLRLNTDIQTWNRSKIYKQISEGWGLGFKGEISFPVVVQDMFELYKVPVCDLDGKHMQYLNSKVLQQH